MDYDFDYYAGQDIKAPKLPSRPFPLGANATPDAFCNYADELEKYENDLNLFNADWTKYCETVLARMEEFKQKLMVDYDIDNRQGIER